MPLRRNIVLALAVFLVHCAVGAVRPAVAGDAPWEHWFILEIAGQPAGYVHERFTTGAEGSVLRSDLVMRLGRGGSEVRVEQSGVYTEDVNGRPIELRSVQNMGIDAVDQRWIFEGDHVRHRSRQGERTLERRLDLPEDIGMTPLAAHRFVRERLNAGASRIEYRAMLPESGLEPQEIRMRRVGEEETHLLGQQRAVTVWEQTTSGMPGVMTKLYLSADGHVVRTEVDVPFGRMVTRLATEEEARATGDAAAPQILLETFVRPQRRIESPRTLRRAVYRLSVNEGVMPPLPEAGAQRVRREDERTVVVTIDLDDSIPAPESDAAQAHYLAATAMIDAEDPLIRQLAERAAGRDAKSASEKAEAMRAFVYRFVRDKDLDTAFATASETARTRRGDCSEHAVLLAAMLRAAGIPARVAIGLIYAEEFAGAEHIFGWHMWTQALLEGVWVDLDATLQERSDATHLLTGVTALDEPVAGAAFVQLLSLMGNLTIEVLETGAAR